MLSVQCPGDVNGNKVPDVAVLHHDTASGGYSVIVKDGKEGALISEFVLAMLPPR